MEETLVIEKPADTGTDITDGGRVILFNDDYHTFDQVIQQLIKAIRCTPQQGERMAGQCTPRANAKCITDLLKNACR